MKILPKVLSDDVTSVTLEDINDGSTVDVANHKLDLKCYLMISASAISSFKIKVEVDGEFIVKARGVSEVYVVDIMEKRLEKALELGATGVINGAKEDVLERVKELTDGTGMDLVIETAGTEITTRQAIHMAKKGSNIVLVGYSKSGEMTLPMSLVLDKELTFKTVFRYRHIYPMAIDAVAAGKVNLKGIVTDVFELDEAQKAMDYSVNNKADIVKAVIRIAE